MRFLKQSTQKDVVIGPVWSTADYTYKADLAYNAAGIDLNLNKHGAAKTDVTLANSAGDEYFRADVNGYYILTLSATDTNTLGTLRITLQATGYMMAPIDFTVLPANVYDSLIAGSDYLEIDVTNWKGSAAAAMTGDAYARLGAPAGASIAADIVVIDNFVDDLEGRLTSTRAGYLDQLEHVADHLDNILGDTNELQTDLVNGGRLDLLIDAIKAKTDNLPASPAAVGSAMTLTAAYDAAKTAATQASVDTIDNFLDTEVAAILAIAQKLDTALELDGAVYRYTTNALEQAPSGGGSLTAQQVWEYATRTLSAFAFTPTPSNAADTTAIKAKTDNLPSDPADESAVEAAITAASSPLATAAALAVVDALVDSLMLAVGGGTGAVSFTYTITSSVDGTAVSGVDVWATSDIAGETVLAYGKTNPAGKVTFMLDTGTVYIWRAKSGWVFTNPDTEVVA
jgi:hypothetical protein